MKTTKTGIGIVAKLTSKKKWYKFYTTDNTLVFQAMELMDFQRSEYEHFFFRYNAQTLKKEKAGKIKKIKSEYEQISLWPQFEAMKDV